MPLFAAGIDTAYWDPGDCCALRAPGKLRGLQQAIQGTGDYRGDHVLVLLGLDGLCRRKVLTMHSIPFIISDWQKKVG
jgi:hypothetical protein